MDHAASPAPAAELQAGPQHPADGRSAAASEANATIRYSARPASVSQAKGGAVLLSVATGSGIPNDIRARIFEPFFTTKEVGRGTGQGLALARSIVVDRHGGRLRFETELGRGTTFFVELPIGDRPLPVAA